MACDCNKVQGEVKTCGKNVPPVLQIESKECPILFHTVNIPASAGDVNTLPPTPGAYRNARVFYEADNIAYLYDSDGIPQLLSMPGEGGGAVESVNGQTGIVVLSAGDVGAATTAELSNKQDVLTAGANINITDNTISATDTTYSNFVGTDGVDAGVAGLVPAPATTDAGKFLKADGTWDNAGGGTLYTTYGTNEDGAMTQKATTALVYTAADPKKINIGDNGVTGGTNSIIIGSEDSGTISSSITDSIAIGHNITENSSNTIAIGHDSYAQAPNAISLGRESKTQGQGAVAIGYKAKAESQYSVGIGYSTTASGQYGTALGDGSEAVGSHSQALGVDASAKGDYSVCIGDHAKTIAATGAGSVALGPGAQPRANGVVDVEDHYWTNKGYNSTAYRIISGVYDGIELHDAATVAQGNTLSTSAPTTSTAGVLGQLYTDTTSMHTYQCTAIDTTDPANPSYTWTQRW